MRRGRTGKPPLPFAPRAGPVIVKALDPSRILRGPARRPRPSLPPRRAAPANPRPCRAGGRARLWSRGPCLAARLCERPGSGSF